MRIKELERLNGIEHGGNRKSSSNNYNLKIQKQLADEMGISIPTLQNYKLLADMIPELDDLQDENSKLRALISNNFGRRKNDPAKDRKALETYVSLRGYKQGGTGSNQYMQTCQNGTSAKSTLDEIAKELNMSKRNLQRALRIERNLTDSMKELLDNGEIYHCIGSMVILHLDVKDVDIRKLIFETYKHLDSEIPLCKKFNSDCSRWIELEQFQKWDCFKFYFCYGFFGFLKKYLKFFHDFKVIL